MVLISDLLDKSGYEAALRYLLARQMDIYVIHILAAEEVEPELAGDLQLLDAEDDDAADITVSAPLLKRYRATLEAFCAGARDFCTKRAITYLFTTNPSVATVAGAEVMTLTAGLRSTHEVDGGLFVVSVLPRTPADLAGLLVGDVLVTAEGAQLDEPLDFLRVVRREASGDRQVRIELVRQKRARTVDMRW